MYAIGKLLVETESEDQLRPNYGDSCHSASTGVGSSKVSVLAILEDILIQSLIILYKFAKM